MLWTCVTIETLPAATDALTEMLSGFGIGGFIIEDMDEMKRFLKDNPQSWDYIDEDLLNANTSPTLIKFYIPADNDKLLESIKESINCFKQADYGLPAGSLDITADVCDDEVWLNNWKKYYKPFRIGKNIIIRPFWEEYEEAKGDIVFTINPGNVFGTGLHQSTKLCAEILEEVVRPGQRVLDIGSGSGILSIIALLLGASCADLIDTDPAAREAAYDNARLNNIADNRINVYTGDVFAREWDMAYNIIIANITADVIINLMPLVKRLLKPAGAFIASGIIDTRLKDVEQALTGFADYNVMGLEGWYAVVCRR